MRMKKSILFLMSITMLASMVACGDEASNTETSSDTSQVQTEAAGEVVESTANETETTETETIETVENSDTTFAGTLMQEFMNVTTGNPDKTVAEIADILSKHESIQFTSMTAPVEPGPLAGFSTDITGFKEGATFGPAMGSIAFIGYVFELEEGTIVSDFIETLKSNADPRWQICVEAEETVCEIAENKVCFIMAPLSNEG